MQSFNGNKSVEKTDRNILSNFKSGEKKMAILISVHELTLKIEPYIFNMYKSSLNLNDVCTLLKYT